MARAGRRQARGQPSSGVAKPRPAVIRGKCPRARFGGLTRPDGFCSAATHDPHHNGTGTQDPSQEDCPRWRRCRTSLTCACPAAQDSGTARGRLARSLPDRYSIDTPSLRAIGTLDAVLLVCRGAGGLPQGGTRQPCRSFLRLVAPALQPQDGGKTAGRRAGRSDARTRGVVGTMQPVNQQSRLASGDVRRILRSGKAHG